MDTIRLPENIEKQIRGESFREETIGLSGSRVLMGRDWVLKISPRGEEAERETAALRWLEGRLPVPQLLACEDADGLSFRLMTRMRGRMLCEEDFLRSPERLVRLLAQALEMLRAVGLEGCPNDCRLDDALRRARSRVERGLVDPELAEPETFGPDGFRDPEALLAWLEDNRPEEEPCLVHGDLCLPNLLAEGDTITGFIDCAGMGIADRWQDLALCLRSWRYNLDGTYGGPLLGGYDPDGLLAALGLKMNEEKNRYYLLLDELF